LEAEVNRNEIIVRKMAVVNKQDRLGYIALHWTAMLDKVGIVKILRKHIAR
jgi:hypothetical protein